MNVETSGLFYLFLLKEFCSFMLYDVIFLTNVQRLLAERGIKIVDLAASAGVSPSFLSYLLAGRGNPTLKVMAAISSVLGVSLSYLLNESDISENDTEDFIPYKNNGTPPEGYRWVRVLLTDTEAAEANRLHEKNIKKL